jgi:hypothetical protein
VEQPNSINEEGVGDCAKEAAVRMAATANCANERGANIVGIVLAAATDLPPRLKNSVAATAFRATEGAFLVSRV